LVEARLVEVIMDNDLEIEMNHLFTQNSSKGLVQGSEIDLGTPGNAPLVTQGLLANIRPWSSTNGLSKLDSFFRALINEGKATILSSPNVVVSSGGQTSIITGEEVPIFSSTVSGGTIQVSTTFKQVGVKLRVKVLQIAGDTAEIEVNPEVSAVTGSSTGPSGATSPILAVRQMRATLRLHDREVLSIGGLVREEDRESIRKTPILGDIPLLGMLFRSRRKSRSRTQLLFFLRVHILDEGVSGAARIHIPGRGMEQINHELVTPPEKEKKEKGKALETNGESSREKQ
jgi:general secretion pathway protein D